MLTSDPTSEHDSAGTSEGVSSEGVSSEGVLSEGVLSEGVLSEGVSSEGVSSEGVLSAGFLSEGMLLEGVLSEGVLERYLPICQHRILHIASSSLDQISAFQFVEMAQQILALTAHRQGLDPEHSAEGQGLDPELEPAPGLGPGLGPEITAEGPGLAPASDLGPICFRLLVPAPLRVAVWKVVEYYFLLSHPHLRINPSSVSTL